MATLKLDLSGSSQGDWAELQEISRREGACRVSVLVSTEGAWAKMDSLRVSAADDPQWVAIKVPGIDGTEIWLVPASKQESIEKRIGFGKPSAPLLRFGSERLASLRFRDPFHAGSEIRLEAGHGDSRWGMASREPAHPISPAMKSNLQDLGSIAFEDPV